MYQKEIIMKKKSFQDFEFALRLPNNLSAYIRSVGHFNLTEPNPSSFWNKAFFAELFWCIDGKGYFELDGKRHMIRPGDIWYYPTGSKHYFYPADDHFHYRWFTIEGPMADALFESVNISSGASYGGNCPEELFARLELDIKQSTLKKRLELLAVGFKILCTAAAGVKQKRPENNYLSEARSIMENDFSNPELNIQTLAKILHINRVQLSRDFAIHYGVTPSDYLKNLRVQKAVALLRSSSLHLDKIATSCGFNSGDYLGKVIISATGKKPSEYRQ